MTATYTFYVLSTLDGYGSYARARRLGRVLGQAGARTARRSRLALYDHRAPHGLRGQHACRSNWERCWAPNTE